MYTYKEAQKILEYYLDKVIGKPIDKVRGEELLTDYLKIEELKNSKFTVLCYSKAALTVSFYRNIDLVAKDLELPLPSDIIK